MPVLQLIRLNSVVILAIRLIMNSNLNDEKDYFIGFSAYDRYRELYEYIENSCFIADSLETYQIFIENCWVPSKNYQPIRISFSEMVDDFGASAWRYAIEPLAFNRFKTAAEIRAVKYEVKPYWNDSKKDADCLFALRL